MSDHLRFAVAYWHTLRGTGSDPFGGGVYDRPWGKEKAPLSAAESTQDAMFEFVQKLGVKYYCFHDRDMAPEGAYVGMGGPRTHDEWSVFMHSRRCNWMQALEGDIDTSHATLLHLGKLEAEDLPEGSMIRYGVMERAPRYSVVDTDYGTSYGAYRAAGPDDYYWRIANFLLPFYTMVPVNTLGAIQIVVDPARRGTGLAGVMIKAMKANARAHGFRKLIACVRPTEKDRYPLTPIERYAFWTRPDGDRRVGCLWGRASRRKLDLHWFVPDWRAFDRFLAVRK